MGLWPRNRASMGLGLAAAIAGSLAAASSGHAAPATTPTLVHDGLASTSPYGAATPLDHSVNPPAPDHNTSVTEGLVQTNNEVEPSIAVNPGNPKDIVTDFQVDRVDVGGDAENGFATSVDGGQTWTQGLLPGLTKDWPGSASVPAGGPFDRASDAVVAFGPAGTNQVYASSLVFDDSSQNGLPSGMAINVSKDGGLTWSAPVFLEQDSLGGLNDKNWVVVDTGSGSGHHTGRVYVVWDRIAPMVYAYCDPDRVGATTPGCDNADNWSSSATNSITGQTNGFYVFGTGPGIGSIPVIQNDGSLSIFYKEDDAGNPIGVSNTDQPTAFTGNQPIEVTTAPMAGAVVWPAPLTFTVADTHPVGQYTVNKGVQEQRAGSLITAAVDPTTNQLYAGWEDSSFRATDGLNDAVFVTSTDGGITWSPMAAIDPNKDGSFIDNYNPSLAVGKDSVVRTIYRQRSEPTGALSPVIDTYYQQSSDGGKTWSAPLKVDTQATNVNYGAYSRGGLFEGDYDQVAVGSDGVAYAVRDEAYAPTPGAPPAWPRGATTFMDPPSPNEFQATWVAAIAPQAPAASVPDARWVPALALLGGAVAVALATRRRRRGDVSDAAG